MKEFIIRAAADCHVELTTLIVPRENDEISEMEEEVAWIASVEDATGKMILLHVTRFFQLYHMLDREATDTAQIHRLADTAKKYLNYVFVGNCSPYEASNLGDYCEFVVLGTIYRYL